MIKHSVSRVFEYLLEDEDNYIKVLAPKEFSNMKIICKTEDDFKVNNLIFRMQQL